MATTLTGSPSEFSVAPAASHGDKPLLIPWPVARYPPYLCGVSKQTPGQIAHIAGYRTGVSADLEMDLRALCASGASRRWKTKLRYKNCQSPEDGRDAP
jgi:hypothetical protein